MAVHDTALERPRSLSLSVGTARYEPGSGVSLADVLRNVLDTPISPELLRLGAGGEITQCSEDLVGPYALHDFFLAKSVDALAPGGVLALVTSHYTLDKQNAAIREYLAERADFLGAIRLPSDAFKREGTSVVTDIVFLRKRA